MQNLCESLLQPDFNLSVVMRGEGKGDVSPGRSTSKEWGIGVKKQDNFTRALIDLSFA